MCAQEMASKLTSAIGANDKMAEQVETSRENATLLINQAFEQLHQAIEERKKTLLSEMGAISFEIERRGLADVGLYRVPG